MNNILKIYIIFQRLRPSYFTKWKALSSAYFRKRLPALFPHFFQMHIHYNFCLYEPSIHPQDIPNQACCSVTKILQPLNLFHGNKKERQLSLYHLGMPYYFYFNHLSLSVCIKAFKISKSSTVVIFYILLRTLGTICISIFSSSSANKVQEATEFTIPFL